MRGWIAYDRWYLIEDIDKWLEEFDDKPGLLEELEELLKIVSFLHELLEMGLVTTDITVEEHRRRLESFSRVVERLRALVETEEGSRGEA